VEATPQRHHRTALLLGALARLDPQRARLLLESLQFGVSIDPAVARTPAGQAVFLTAVNVLARSAGAVSIAAPSAPLVLPGLPWTAPLDETAATIAMWAGARVSTTSAAVGVHVGERASGAYVLASGDAWVARIDREGSSFSDNTATLGAVAASHLACARAFHIGLAMALGLPAVGRDPVELSLWRGESPPALAATAIGDTTLVGAGAVAHGMLWALALSDVRVAGALVIFDPQQLDATNINRHLLAGVGDVGRAKAELAAAFIRPHAPSVVARVERFVRPPDVLDRVVTTVDNDATRYEIQGTFPRRLFHAATSAETVAVAVLDGVDGACLGCLFPPPHTSQAELIARETGLPLPLVESTLATNGPVTNEMLPAIASRLGVAASSLVSLLGRSLREVYARDLCGRLPVAPGTDTPAATIAYASGLAGTLLAAELVKHADPQLRSGVLRNYLQVSAPHPASAWAAFRQKQDDCPLMCGSDALQQVVRKLHQIGTAS
jgi:molybdopterin/thiamine biosynthesis adenylyltransferase